MLSALVHRARIGTGSKMRAYDTVGDRIGASGSWVRKAIGRQPVGLDGHVLDNIRTAYARLCDRIATGADAIAADNDQLRRDLDAALGGDRPVRARVAGAPPAEEAAPRGAGAASASALVAPAARPGVPGEATGADLTDLPLFRGRVEE